MGCNVDDRRGAIALGKQLDYDNSIKSRDRETEQRLYPEEGSCADFREIVGKSPALKITLNLVSRVAPTDSSVLILGETGTGKELIARATHTLSSRRERAFVRLNCAAIPLGLLERPRAAPQVGSLAHKHTRDLEKRTANDLWPHHEDQSLNTRSVLTRGLNMLSSTHSGIVMNRRGMMTSYLADGPSRFAWPPGKRSL